MSALLAFVATASLNPVFVPKFAPVIVGVANEYLNHPSRMIFEMTRDPFSVFASEAIKGHNALVVVQKNTVPPVDHIKKTMNGKCDFLIFLGPTNEAPSEWQKLRWNPGGRILIVAQADAARALKIIQNIWAVARTHNVLVAAINKDALEFYQWSPYRIGECRNVETVDSIDEWRNGKFTRNASFYMNFSSLNGCDLLFTATEVYPYVLQNFTNGVEIHLLKLLAASFNFSLRYVPIPKSENFFGVKIFNGTDWYFSGPLKMLYEQIVDLAFTGMTATIDRYEASSPVYPHMMENIVWTVPAPVVLSPIQNAFGALSPSSWFLIILTLFVGSIAVFMTQDPRCFTYGKSFFYTLGTLLNSMPPFKTSGWYLRIITAGIIILAMHFFIAYQSTLIVLLTTPILGEPYGTLKDVMDANLTCFAYSAGIRMLQLEHDEKNTPTSFYMVNGSVNDYFHGIAYKRDSYLLMPEISSNYLSWRKYLDENGRNLLARLKAPFMVLPISFYMAPGHPLAPLMDKKILQMVDCGIVDYWNDLTKQVKFTTGDQQQRKLQPLSYHHLAGAFAIVVAALTVSLLIFIIELLLGKSKKKANKTIKSHSQPRKRLL